MERGYASVTLRDIANALSIRQASLYHHVPGGKEELFVEVVERTFQRHHDGIQQAIAGAGDDLRTRLRAVALWLLSQSPMDMTRTMKSDMHAISPEHAGRLMKSGYEALLLPIQRVFVAAHEAGHIRLPDPDLLAGSFLSIVAGIHNAPVEHHRQSRYEMAVDMIDVLLDGLRYR